MPDIRALITSLICLSLAGCAPDSGVPKLMDDYVTQVASAVELTPELSEVAPVPLMPRRRDRVLEMPDLDMGMLDFLSLYGCELQYVVGERNSIMGRVMQPLNRLRYEIRFIRSAEDCIPEAEREGVKEELEEAIDSKTKTLSIAIWNATWGVEEVEKLFTLSQGYYPLDGGGGLVAELTADVTQLNRTVAGLLAGNSDEPLGYVGEVHQRWQAEHRAGQLMNSARLVTARLDDATSLMARKMESDSLCPNEEGGELPEILGNLYANGYVGSVQPYLESIEQARTALIEPLERLAILQSDTMPDAFRVWYQQNLDTEKTESLWGQLKRAVESHNRHWQQLASQCDISTDP